MEVRLFQEDPKMRIVPPEGLDQGIYISITKYFAFAWGWHTLQCDQRWYAVRLGHKLRDKGWHIRFGYRTVGDADATTLTYEDAGWHWPWRWRSTSGSYI